MTALKRAVPLAALLAALATGGALLATTPWEGGTAVREAAATPAEFGVCNVSVREVPDGVEAFALPFPEGGLLGAKWALVLRIAGAGLRLDPKLGYATEPDASGVTINAETGDVIAERYANSQHEAKLQAALATLAVGPWEPRGPAWPRTDTAPASEFADALAPVTATSDREKAELKYRQTESGSGMLAGPFIAGDQAYLKLETCQSDALIDAEGRVVKWDVAPAEEEMFQRFLDEVVVLP